jgi:hypothetical protein
MFGAPKQSPQVPTTKPKKISPIISEPPLKASDLPGPDVGLLNFDALDPAIRKLVTWTPGAPVPYKFLAEMLAAIEAES